MGGGKEKRGGEVGSEKERRGKGVLSDVFRGVGGGAGGSDSACIVRVGAQSTHAGTRRYLCYTCFSTSVSVISPSSTLTPSLLLYF